jgi:hypothetical protein
MVSSETTPTRSSPCEKLSARAHMSSCTSRAARPTPKPASHTGSHTPSPSPSSKGSDGSRWVLPLDSVHSSMRGVMLRIATPTRSAPLAVAQAGDPGQRSGVTRPSASSSRVLATGGGASSAHATVSAAARIIQGRLVTR